MYKTPYKPKAYRKNKHKFAAKAKKPFKKFRRIITSLDRLSRKRLHALRSTYCQGRKSANRHLVRYSHDFVTTTTPGVVHLSAMRLRRRAYPACDTYSAGGPLLAACNTVLRFTSKQTRRLRIEQKYRVKLSATPTAATGIQHLNFKARPLRHLKRVRRRSIQLSVVRAGSLRLRAFTRALIHSRQQQLSARRMFSSRLFTRTPRRRRVSNRFPYKAPRPRTRRLSKETVRVQNLRHRLTRANGRGVEVTFFRRWWSRGRLLKRRRRLGKRFFSGIFGRSRWRLERKDKFRLRRARRRYPAKRVVLYRTIAAGLALRTDRRALRRLALSTAVYASVAKSRNLVHTPSAYLRISLRRLARSWKFVRRVPRRKARVLKRQGGRLDYQTKNLRLSNTAAYSSRVFAATSNCKHRPLLRVLRVNRGRKGLGLAGPGRLLRRRYNVWHSGQSARKLLLQRRLRTAALSYGALPSRVLSHPRRVLRALLIRRGTASRRGPFTALNAISTKVLRNRLFASNYLALSAEKGTALAVNSGPTAALYRRGRVRAPFRVAAVVASQPSFLSHVVLWSALAPRADLRAILQGTTSLTLQQHRYRELRFYQRRPRLRLPNTAVSRARRRKGGLVTFARNSLKQPKSLLGQRQLLLPPVRAYTRTSTSHSTSKRLLLDTLSTTTERRDAWPSFWKRPHTRANIRAINRLRRKQYRKSKRLYAHVQRKQALERWRALLAISTSRPLSIGTSSKLLLPTPAKQSAGVQLSVHKARSAPVRKGLAESLANTRAILTYPRHRKGRKSVPFYRLKPSVKELARTTQFLTPTLSRTMEWNALLPQPRPTVSQKAQGLLQARSVRSMLEAERLFSAWTPQLSVRNRRAHYPRLNGVPRPRRFLGFKARRDRRNFNARLLKRNIPQRRYTDYAPIKLQYYFGSVGSVGYRRLRRVYRAPSAHNRWWRPNKQAAPFAHPFSRRALNAKRYLHRDLSRVRISSHNTITRLMRDTRGISLHSKFPPRIIPWRNFHYPSPRRGATPRTLSRWTFTTITGKVGRTAPVKARLTLQRTAREVRALDNYSPACNVWKNRRWAALDKTTRSVAVRAQLFAVFRSIPRPVWRALQIKAGSVVASTVTQLRLLAQFRHWAYKQFTLLPAPLSVVKAQARLYLIHLLTTALGGETSSAFTSTVAEQHSALRSKAFTSRVNRKAMRALRLRELPRLDGNFVAGNILQRERGGLYKRWLSGAEGIFKRSQRGYTATSRSRYTANVATAFGRRRVRFPASGRRRKSYDSLLHAFAKKVGPSRLRQVSTLRFKRVRPTLSSDFREDLIVGSPLCGLNRRRLTSQKLSQAAYLSSSWRELLRYRMNISTADAPLRTITGLKRRFLSLPLRSVFTERRKLLRRGTLLSQWQMHVARAGILRRALRRRREERAFVDLRQAVLQRRLPREQATRPWKLRRAAKRYRAAKAGPYSRHNIRTRSATPGRWTLSHLSAVGPRSEYMRLTPLVPVLASGERIAIPKAIIRKNRLAFRGFVLPTARSRKARKLRRQQRDTRKRRRMARRMKRASRLAAIRNTKHWSEKRDRHFRNVAFNHRCQKFARNFSWKLVGKANRRFGINAQSNFCGARDASHARLLTFMRRAQAARVRGQRTESAVTPSAVALRQVGSFHRRWRVAKLWKKSRLTQIRYRTSKLSGRVLQKIRMKTAVEQVYRKAVQTVASQLIESVDVFSSITPLWFQKPVTQVVKSQFAREEAALVNIAAKEERYKLTAQYVESLTAFIPELMNYMLSRRLENSQIKYTTAQHLARNIYWSLRVYLNVDPFDARFFLRDKSPAARVRLFEDISGLSEAQKTEQPQRATLRYRFQPSRLLLAPNTMRFRGDWLRAFFPAWHALYQENPEDYGKFLLKTRRIRRLRIGPRGMASWNTAHQLVSHETRARQLLTLRYSRNRTRFETVLQTARRAPHKECTSPEFDVVARTPFFTRQFSTYANRGLALISRWIHRRKRFIAFESGWRTVTPVTQVLARSRTLPRVEARGRTSYIVSSTSAVSNSRLDLRFVRAKSPRSQQYLVRSSRDALKLNKSEKLLKLIFYCDLRNRKAITNTPNVVHWTRSRRRSAAVSLRYDLLQSPAEGGEEENFRAEYPVWRAHDTLFVRAAYRWGSTQSQLFGSRKFQPDLQRRTARGRTGSNTYKRGLVLSQKAIFATSSFLWLRQLSRRRLLRRRNKSSLKSAFRFATKLKAVMRPRKVFNGIGSLSVGVKEHSTVSNREPRKAPYFRTGVGRQLLRSVAFARACASYTHFYQQAPFEAHRPRLWDNLTLLWMKKYRIGRYWLRDTARWLRDPWLSEIVACDMTLRPDRFGGELRSRQQQVGEYVAEVDAEGRSIRRKDAPKERHKYQKILPAVKDPELMKTNTLLKRAPVSTRMVTRHRISITRQARRKPIPSLRLANYEFRDVIREHKENKAKSVKQKAEEEQARVEEYWARKAKKLPPERPRRLPLKHPANLWLPHVIWKEIQRRIRKLEWRESDEVFFRRGFRTAFQFYPNERRKAPWLEHLMYTRATYSTRLREFRRRQYPHEQKKFKWLQRVRKMLYPGRGARYIKGRRWPQLRRYNQKLHYSLFDLRDRGAARRRFKKLNGRTRPAISAFVSKSRGLTDRLDITCLKVGVAPSIYWARIVAEFGLLRVNGTTVYDPAYRLKPADVIYPNWDTIARFQHYFKPQLRAREEYQRRNRASTAFYPTNMEYHPGTRAIIYKHAPDESDLRKSSRLQPTYFRWFKLDSV